MKKTIKSQIFLLEPSGRVSVPVQINYSDNEPAGKSLSEMILWHNNAAYQGNGNDYLLTDTFADLQRTLPHGSIIACCMTCRHGNMCPYGNTVDRIYCTKGHEIRSIEDVHDYFDANEPHSLQTVSVCSCCDDFVCQSDSYYTYNDYLLRLREKERA